MPMYDFKCPKGHEFERIVLTYDLDQKTECPECGATADTFIPQGGRRNVRFNFNFMES